MRESDHDDSAGITRPATAPTTLIYAAVVLAPAVLLMLALYGAIIASRMAAKGTPYTEPHAAGGTAAPPHHVGVSRV